MKDYMFISPTYGQMDLKKITQRIKEYIEEVPEAKYILTIGTDSQNHDQTKIVMVIALHRVGRGGIFFYDINKIPLLQNLRQKIVYETQMSLQLANELMAELERFDLDQYNIHYQIHCDIGKAGKTNELIPEITSWVKACGYECLIKPNSYTASAIANKFSK